MNHYAGKAYFPPNFTEKNFLCLGVLTYFLELSQWTLKNISVALTNEYAPEISHRSYLYQKYTFQNLLVRTN